MMLKAHILIIVQVFFLGTNQAFGQEERFKQEEQTLLHKIDLYTNVSKNVSAGAKIGISTKKAKFGISYKGMSGNYFKYNKIYKKGVIREYVKMRNDSVMVKLHCIRQQNGELISATLAEEKRLERPMRIWRYYRNVCIELTSFKTRFDKKVELIKAAEILPEKK